MALSALEACALRFAKNAARHKPEKRKDYFLVRRRQKIGVRHRVFYIVLQKAVCLAFFESVVKLYQRIIPLCLNAFKIFSFVSDLS